MSVQESDAYAIFLSGVVSWLVVVHYCVSGFVVVRSGIRGDELFGFFSTFYQTLDHHAFDVDKFPGRIVVCSQRESVGVRNFFLNIFLNTLFWILDMDSMEVRKELMHASMLDSNRALYAVTAALMVVACRSFTIVAVAARCRIVSRSW